MPDLFQQGHDPIDDTYHVNVHNDLVLARMEWTLMMHRIMMVLVSRIDSRNQSQFKTQFVRVKNLMEVTGNTGNGQYGHVQEAVRRLIREPVEVMTRGSYSGVPLFDEIRYEAYRGLISARFHDKADQYLLRLSERFTSWRLDQTIPLTSSYAIRHYMIGKYVERRGRANAETFSVEDYRKKLKCEDKYDQFADLKRRVIEPALEQVNEETDLQLRYEVLRDGRTPVRIRFKAHAAEASPSDRQPQVPEEPDVADHTRWLHEELNSKEFEWVMEKAEDFAESQGYSRENERTWKVGVNLGVRSIYRDRQEELE